MQITLAQLNNSDLSALGREAVALLVARDIDTLAARFGYALACGRAPSDAIREELSASLVELGANSLRSSAVNPVVKYFEPNDTKLLALVECFVRTDNGAEILLELIVSGNKQAAHVTLEQVSAAA